MRPSSGTRHVLVISAGFKEIGGEGVERENRLRAIARENGMSILGPNCLGMINTDPQVSMNATFGRDIPPHGTSGADFAERCSVCRPARLRQGTRHRLLAVREFRQQVRRGRGRSVAVDRGGREHAGHHDVRRGRRERPAVPRGGPRDHARRASQADHGHQERSHGGGRRGGRLAHRFAGRFGRICTTR